MIAEIHFGPYRLDILAGELYKGRMKIPVQRHPLTLLQLLTDRPGEIISREEIRARLWPNGTVVDFEHSVNSAVKKIRAALADTTEKPRYIETIPRKGYRFLQPVQRVGEAYQGPEPILASSLRGQHWSHYRILDLIAEGGMSLVYAAVDVHLDRKVALKILPQGTASRSTLNRFQSEARTISALDHPNICTIYEFGEHLRRPFMAMQLLEGQTLKEHIANAGVADNRLFAKVAFEIADALDVVHRAGFIHGDIKPANIFLTNSDQVKVLDFGIASLTGYRGGQQVVGGTDDALAPCNKISGTAAYMSPEQLRGNLVDARTDIFSLGVVLYELAGGRHPFSENGGTNSSESARKGLSPVPPSRFNSSLSAKADALVVKALQTDRENRFANAAEMRDAALEISTDVKFPAAKKSLWTLRFAGVAALAAVAMIVAAIFFASKKHAASALDRQSFRVKAVTSSPGVKDNPAISPDGEHVAFAWTPTDARDMSIYVQALGSKAIVRLTTSPARDVSPAWSPDGRNIAFIRRWPTRSAYYIVLAAGGPERWLADGPGISVPWGRQIDWSPDGKYLIVTESAEGHQTEAKLYLLSVQDGQSKQSFSLPSERFLTSPAFSPDGSSVAVVAGPNQLIGDLYVVSIGTGVARRLTSEGRQIESVTWTPDGRDLVFSSKREGPFNLWRMPATGGRPESVLQMGLDAVAVHFSKTGHKLIFLRNSWDTNLWRVDGPAWKGLPSPPRKIVDSTREDSQADYSPDGKMITFDSNRSGAFEIWTSKSDGSVPVQLTSFGGVDSVDPRWSPDGNWIAFDSSQRGRSEIYIASPEGGAPRLLTKMSGRMPTWSRDSKRVYFTAERAGEQGIFVTSIDNDNPVLVAAGTAWNLNESPDEMSSFYEREDGLWRRDREAGLERQVINVHSSAWQHGAWGFCPNEICFLNFQVSPYEIDSVSLNGEHPRRIASIGTWPRVYGPLGFAVSPNGDSILYQRVDEVDSEILLIDDFR